MGIEDNLFGDFLPKRNESSQFASSQASVSTCMSHRSRLSLTCRQRAQTANTPSTTTHTTRPFVKPLAVDRPKKNDKRKHLGLARKNVFCPNCGLPERLLIHTVAFHVSTCKRKRVVTEDCEAGEACSSSCVKHFRTHRHTVFPKPNVKVTGTMVPTVKTKLKLELSNRDFDDMSSSSQSTLPDNPCNGTSSPSRVSAQQETDKTRFVGTQTDDTNFGKGNDNPSGPCGTTTMNNNIIESSQETYFTFGTPEKVTPPKDKQTTNGPTVSSSKDSWKTCNASSTTSPPNVLMASKDTSPSIDSWKTCNVLPVLGMPMVPRRTSVEPPVESTPREPHTSGHWIGADTRVQENVTQVAIAKDKAFSDYFESPSLLQIPTDPNNSPSTRLIDVLEVRNGDILPSPRRSDTGIGQEPTKKDVGDDNTDICSLSTVRREVTGSPARAEADRGTRVSGRTAPKCRANIRTSGPDAGYDGRTTTPVRSSTVPCRCKVVDDGGVCANVTVRVLPAKPDGSTPSPQTAVKVNATCCESGWEAIGIDAAADVCVSDVRVSLCECTKELVLDCRVADANPAGRPAETTFRPKFHSTMEALGMGRTRGDGKRQVQLSITSFLKGAKRAKTIPKAVVDEVECVDDFDSGSDFSSKEVKGETLLERNRRSKLAWQQLMAVNKSRDFTYVSAGSSSGGSHSGNNSDRIAPTVGGGRKCPFYKKIPETTFVVDAFNYGNIPGINAYFLSHFHYDHYIGLRRSFNQRIYCTRITASLVRLKIGVNNQYLNELKLDEVMLINGVRVTALEANHCPGSAMFLFQLANGKTFLHVGDFRAEPAMESYPAFWNLSIDKLFLDTTYCNPRYTFPSQLDTIGEVVSCAEVQLAQHPKTLFVCGAYTIGKEKVFVGISEAIDAKLWASVDKRRILSLLEDPVIASRLVTDPLEAQVHVCKMKDLNHENLQAQLSRYRRKFTHIMAFKPSGWEYSNGLHFKRFSRGNVTVVGVPYSEHSSFSELRRFVQYVKPAQVIPTVNVGRPEMRREMQKHFDEWLKESSQDIRRFFSGTSNGRR